MIIRIVSSKWFNGLIVILLIVTGVLMTLEDVWLQTRPGSLAEALVYTDCIISAIFLLESALLLFAR